ncbi:hypothetical protein NMY22_g6681 [Coprinellus aureogranulatus]|nr:hypothetical protein NMY22_g6681 [Coprinellus aureogranulatus]
MEGLAVFPLDFTLPFVLVLESSSVASIPTPGLSPAVRVPLMKFLMDGFPLSFHWGDVAKLAQPTAKFGNLDERCTDALIWELMLQAGPVVNVHLPKDRISMAHQGYGFCEFLTEEDAEYACKIMNQIKLWGKPIRVNKASSDKKQLDVGANLFVGNLDENVDERLLYDTFSAFGMMATTAKVRPILSDRSGLKLNILRSLATQVLVSRRVTASSPTQTSNPRTPLSNP